MTEETNKPAPGSFAHLMSPTPPEKDKEPVKKKTRKVRKPKDNPGRPYVRTDSTSVRTDVLTQIPPTPERRHPERYAFQFWADQITRLKKLRQVLNLANDPEDRQEVTLSDMVRQAVDDYLDRQIKQINQGVRSNE
jgi:hypothetical protein